MIVRPRGLTDPAAVKTIGQMDNLPSVYLARHCKTQYNLEGRVQGTLDVPLSDIGRAEARAHAPTIRGLGIERIVCSPLQRGQETARIYAEHGGLPLSVSPKFREIDLGAWEGKTHDELLSDPLYRRWLEDPSSVAVPESAESAIEAQRRIIDAIQDLVVQYPGERVLIVIHKFVRALLRCALLELDLSHFRGLIDESTDPVQIPDQQIRGICQGKT